jgi:hypothetical protein
MNFNLVNNPNSAIRIPHLEDAMLYALCAMRGSVPLTTCLPARSLGVGRRLTLDALRSRGNATRLALCFFVDMRHGIGSRV